VPIVYYPAIIEAGRIGFGVAFPDLPGCVSAGDTPQDAARNAEVALRAHLGLMQDDGDAIPEPSDIDHAPRDPDVREVARILVRADLPGKAQRLNISLDENLVARIDAAAEARGMTRSAFLAEGARRLIEQG
jgi:predicted RNase H-like HicB family nuclease